MRTPKIPDSLKVFVRALAARLAPRASRSGKTSATAEKAPNMRRGQRRRVWRQSRGADHFDWSWNGVGTGGMADAAG
jgi:hypothetical protein